MDFYLSLGIFKTMLMNFYNSYVKIFVFLVSIFSLSSCIKDIQDDLDDLKNNGEIQKWGATLIHTKILPENIDSGSIKIYPDGQVYYTSYQDSLFNFKSKDFINFPSSFSNSNTTREWGPGRLAEFNLVKGFTLQGFLNSSPVLSGTPLLQTIIASHGFNTNVPAFGPINISKFTINTTPTIGNLTIEVEEGDIKFSMINNTDVPFTNVSYDLIMDDSFGPEEILHSGILTSVGANATAEEIINVAGKSLRRNFRLQINSMSTPGTTTPITVDINKTILFTVTQEPNLKVAQAISEMASPTVAVEFPYELDNFGTDFTEDYTSIRFKSGVMTYTVTPDNFTDYDFRIVFVNSDSNGVLFAKDIVMTGTFGSGAIDLANVTVDLTAHPDFDFNTMNVAIEATPNATSKMNYNKNDEVRAILKLINVDYQILKGDFKNQVFPIDTGSVPWGGDILSKVSGQGAVKNSKLTIHSRSTIGIPFEYDIDGYGENSAGDQLDIDLNSKFVLDGATNVGDQVEDSFDFDMTNSNVDEVLSFFPRWFYSWGDMESNPSGTTENFVTDNSTLQIDVEVEVPLNLWADTLRYTDTVGYATSDLDDLKEADDSSSVIDIHSAFLHIDIENKYPLSIGADLVVIDTLTSTAMDTIVLSELVRASEVDAAGYSSTPSTYYEKIEIDEELRKALTTGNGIYTRVYIKSQEANKSQSKFVIVRDTDYVDVRLGVEVHTSVNVE